VAVSTTGTYLPKPVAAPALAAPAPGNALVAVTILVLFALAAVVSAARKDVSLGFDEVAHVSYVAHIQASGDLTPALEAMRLIDPQTFRFTGAANYLNHPPFYYALHALLGPALAGRPQALFAHRLIDVAMAAAGLAALLGLGLAARLPRLQFYAYAVPVVCVPVLAPLAGAVNDDNLAFCGGAVAMLGVWQLVATGRGKWLAPALAGVAIAGLAKLTGLLLTAPLVSGGLVYLLWRRRLTGAQALTAIVAAALVFALAAAPYCDFMLRYGSPTPQTPAQLALIADGARAAGWADLPRRSFPGYVLYFVGAFVAGWMPTLGARGALNDAMLVIPVAALGCAAAGCAVSLRRLRRRQERALDVVVIAGALALAATFAVHVGYSYSRYVATGWLMDAYPRYYLPLIAIVPLAGLSLLAAIETPRRRNALLMFLIAGPIVFRLFGAPL